ncbi:MAG: hypothetical protein Q9M97_08600 [Candidatus Gracilibacteria bacterium]|nr:hypothetical protein [Candidatus Gracilibacteria bacterium]MDQ7023528.1 hypothetical protein [Candidatus Gracilibacteria bacterium]
MYSLPYFKKILNLNWRKSKIMGIYEKNNNLVFQIRGKYNNTDCINCGLKTSKRKDKSYINKKL